MASEQETDEKDMEYKAKAVLLRMSYDPSTQCFYSGIFIGKNWLDRDTLEPVSYAERARRRTMFLADKTGE